MIEVQDRPPSRAYHDAELIDTLIAISVVAKRLAEKLRKQLENDRAFPGSRRVRRRED